MKKNLHPQYITDEHGERISVVLPIQEWQQVVDELEELENIMLQEEVKSKQEPAEQLTEQEASIYTGDSQEISKPKEWYDCSKVLLFTSKGNVYNLDRQRCKTERQLKSNVEFERGEKCLAIIGISDDDEQSYRLILGFKNGYVAKMYTDTFLTKRKKLSGAFDGGKCIFIRQISDDIELVAVSSTKKVLIFDTDRINVVSSRKSYGVRIMELEYTYLETIKELVEVSLDNPKNYRRTSYPAVGRKLMDGDDLKLDSEE